jgi:prepilin-type N-terminal cleavage/methylation domain-containing protein
MKFHHPEPRQSNPARFILEMYLRTSRKRDAAIVYHGFTLIELLVSMIVGAILSTLLLLSAVQLMGTNQREAARSDTQREVQAALDYIARDLREAVYVYDGECLRTVGIKKPPGVATAVSCPGVLSAGAPGTLVTADNVPVLAFWRVDPLPSYQANYCKSNATTLSGPLTADTDEGRLPCNARKMYTLVVYSLNRPNVAGTKDNIWRGRARITRATLAQYPSDSSDIKQSEGWASPTQNFPNWPLDKDNKPRAETAGGSMLRTNQVLVDFIDDNRLNTARTATSTCPKFGVIEPEKFQGFYRSLPVDTGSAANSFYACVRGSDNSTVNQEVIVRINGSAAGRPGIKLTEAVTPTAMEARVMTRGVLGKQ